jgi:hypothetical protein
MVSVTLTGTEILKVFSSDSAVEMTTGKLILQRRLCLGNPHSCYSPPFDIPIWNICNGV